MSKYDNLILVLLLASILSLVGSVFAISFFFTKELLLLALFVIFAIGIFYSMATRKDSTYAYAMLFFVVGIANAFFMYFMTNALITYLLIVVNIIGFIIVLQTVGEKPVHKKKEEKIIIKEVSAEDQKSAEKKRMPAHKAKHKKAKISAEDLLNTEQQILDELDKAIEKKAKSVNVKPAKPSRNRLNEYYDESDETDGTAVPTKEIDDFVNALNKYEKTVKKASKPKAKKKAKKR